MADISGNSQHLGGEGDGRRNGERRNGDRRVFDRRRSNQREMLLMERLTGAVEDIGKQSTKTQDAINSIRNDVAEVKLDVQKIGLEQESFVKTYKATQHAFNKAYDKQVNHCLAVHNDFEERLRGVPGAPSCNSHKERLDRLEEWRDLTNSKIYKFMGIISVIVFAISIVVPWSLNHYGNKQRKQEKAIITRQTDYANGERQDDEKE